MSRFKAYIEIDGLNASDKASLHNDVRGVLENNYPTCNGIIKVRIEELK